MKVKAKKLDTVKEFRYDLTFKTKDGKPEVFGVVEPTKTIDKSMSRKDYLKNTLYVEYNGNEYSADERSLLYMNIILSIANGRYNAAVANGMDPKEAYNAIYNRTIPWKNKKGQWTEVRIGDLPDALERAMIGYKKIIETIK